jgi:hypothetical protein
MVRVHYAPRNLTYRGDHGTDEYAVSGSSRIFMMSPLERLREIYTHQDADRGSSLNREGTT